MSDLNPMSTAPRNGKVIRLFRKPHPNRKFRELTGRWIGGPDWRATTPTGSAAYPWDHDLDGWLPYEDKR